MPCLTPHLGWTLCVSLLYAWSRRRLCRLWTHYTNLSVGLGFWELQVGVARESQNTGCETHTRSRGLRREHGCEEERIRWIHLGRRWYGKYRTWLCGEIEISNPGNLYMGLMKQLLCWIWISYSIHNWFTWVLFPQQNQPLYYFLPMLLRCEKNYA